VPERVRFAVELLDPWPGERVLEIGCGPGVAAELVCARLGTGSLLAVDRSEVATGRAARRCAAHLAAGRLELRTCGLDRLDVPAASLDAAFAVDVNLFWTGPATRELGLLHAALRPGGRLLACYGGGGPQEPDRITDAVAAALRQAGFTGVAVRRGTGLAVTATR
jgi:ubiquinone/menaquinone biosynthesis C-methylase UbiE